MKIVNFIIFSSLGSYSGGRETWLNNFIPVLIKRMPVVNIRIYHLDNIKNAELIGITKNKELKFIPVKHRYWRCKIITFLQILYFSFIVSRLICKSSCDGDIVIAIGTFYESFALFLIKFFCKKKIKRVSWIRGIWKKESTNRHGKFISHLSEKIELKLLNYSQVLISNGYDTKEYYSSFIRKNIVCIPNAIDLAKYDFIDREAFAGEKIIISYIGRLTEVKGIKDYIESIRRFNNRYSAKKNNFIFEIIGDGDLTEFVRCSTNTIENVLFIGALPNEQVIKHLNHIDVGVALTFSQEKGGGGISNGLLEIMASKRLVVAWDSPIFRQILNEQQAYLIKEGDVDALSEIYNSILEHKANHSLMINQSYNVLKKYSIDKHVDMFVNELNKLGHDRNV